MQQKRHNLSGFSLPELMIVLAILGVLFSLSTVNLFGSYNKNTLNTTLTTLISDIKQQQVKAMTGDKSGQPSSSEYGVYFSPDGLSYILFIGSTYAPADPANFEIKLNGDLQFSSLQLPDTQLVFARGSGEVDNFDAGLNKVTLHNLQSNENKTITLNQMGTVVNIN